ncbi:acyl-CoA mutase large subunit family protein [Pyrinomonas methylaliphatogenes]|jgi:methylmalonyl-CoA mutase N-terminal domain/subunit|uniref:Methylmalonyl-CoA mutase n=1 Tax=Pyrinomonas methylaliphatogenes TaxID=454194 RepID=A0A0B6WTP0_9BACT|nr:methylmalonyl-CoA mutase family protein [Pyrinomonas methylaliphatogenes]CDM64416.1 methylmalonyl-CoA mutase [Pyrinomonas methylaliphatogenes]
MSKIKQITTPDQEMVERWERETLEPALRRMPERKERFETVSLEEVNRLYTPADLAEIDFARDIGFPGEFPYTRGIHPTGYRGKLWTMRQFAGFSTPEETNARFKYLMSQGQTGLSVAYDLPTLMGYDADSPMAEGEVGKCGVSVSSLADMEILFDGIPLEEVTVSQTINAPAFVLLAMYLVVAEKQGADWRKISGTLQNDILKEYIAQKEWIYPIRPAMKLVIDTFEFCSEHVPRYNPISVSGYHIREAGATALQELAFTLRDGIEYVEWGVRAGLPVDRFAPRISFFFNAHNDFFEEIAKYRAARKIWAHVMRERFGAQDPRSMTLRFHTQTAGVSLTVQQPLNNIVRVAIQALAAVLGGTQSLHTDAYDEALALPTDQAALIALRTQQIIAEETGVANTVDPLGGSYFVEALTKKMEDGAYDYFAKIDEMGGMVEAIEKGFPQREIQESAYQYQKAVERGDQVIVGVNKYVMEEEPMKVDILVIDESVRDRQVARLEQVRARRDGGRVARTLDQLKRAAERGENIMPATLEAVRAYATLGEICDALRDVYGVYEEPAF